MNAIDNALSGMLKQTERVNVAAERIAKASFSGAPAENQAITDEVDLSREAVALLTSKTLFKANVAVLKAADEMLKSTLDVIA